MSLHQFADDFLTFLERREESLLHWGFHNVQNSDSDIEHALENESPKELKAQWEELRNGGLTFNRLLRKMRNSNLLYRFSENPDLYRTRMAEGVRLLANLRQMFSAQDWATGPKLVSDIKIHLRDRIYPRRDILATDIWTDNLEPSCSTQTKTLLEQCYKALSQTGDIEYKFSGFQQRSFERIFKEYNAGNRTASVVCAGTGSGKTKAFYVPAFLKVAEEIAQDPTPFTKIIAIYPRNVLLADQLREALAETEKLRPVLETNGHRTLTFGALLGRTPRNNWFNPITGGRRRPSWSWEERGDGQVIPYLTSPIDGTSDLIWKDADREAGKTSLYRIGEAQPDIPDNVLRITREDINQNPPDILFLSLEMLNRQMGNPEWARTFGINQGDRAPRLVLLDEVHTYEGVAGAHAAWVLRRWKHWVHQRGNVKSPHFVGLSATLKEAPEHMGRVCGVRSEKVEELTPKPGVGEGGEMESEGQEYNLAIKGDPSSGTALLSTSIQTGMLLARLLTPRGRSGTDIQHEKFFLRKIFGFTDNLDSLNRWFSNMQDAEQNPVLAQYRDLPDPTLDVATRERMKQEGQIWELPINIGYTLNQSLDVSRCSSQDPGVNSGSDLVIASSALEVGFDDPQVGMVLHHKAPRSMASFVQRKGRAGRQRGSRPWTVVVLSDYGRDRWAFQAAERLFQPEIDSIHLPITNPYVLRIQLAFFLVDWLGQRISNGSAYDYLSSPRKNYTPPQIKKAERILSDFLKQEGEWERFLKSAKWFYFYARGLNINNEADKTRGKNELNDIFWEEPRPLLTEIIPSLLRKLEVEWQQAGPSAQIEDYGLKRPMPKALPKATFEDQLDLNESVIELENFRRREKEDELRPISQFLQDTAPGKVSKRFSTGVNEPGYWLELPEDRTLQPGNNVFKIDELYSGEASIGTYNNIQVFCPAQAKLKHRPNEILDSSSSDWEWQTHAQGANEEMAKELHLKGNRPWSDLIETAQAYLHGNGAWIEMLRYADSCRFEIRNRQGQSNQGTVQLQAENGASQAVGFQLHTDGLRFVIGPRHLEEMPKLSDKMMGQLRYEYFLDQLKNSPALADHLNIFKARWMADISAAMLCATAVRRRVTLSEAQQELNGIRLDAARRVLETIFQVQGVDLNGNVQDGRLKDNLLDLWSNPTVVAEIERLESTLWQTPPDPDFDEWVKKRHLATLAQALRVAAIQISDQVNEDDLVVDLIRAEGKDEIYLTERGSGGLGQMESVVEKIKEDPRFFLDSLEYALTHCPRESWADNLLTTTDAAYSEYRSGGGVLTTAFQDVLHAQNMADLGTAKESLVNAMHAHGINARRGDVSAVSMKLLRGGSSEGTHRLTHMLNEYWRRHSQKIKLEIPVRTFAYLVCSYPPGQRRLMNFFRDEYGENPTDSQLYATIQQLLFEGCEDSCPDCLDNKNPFNDFGKPARNLSTPWLSLGTKEVQVTNDPNQWQTQARKVLVEEGRVCLVAEKDAEQTLVDNLAPLYFEELNIQNYKEVVHINQIERTGGRIRVVLQIRDFVNA